MESQHGTGADTICEAVLAARGKRKIFGGLVRREGLAHVCQPRNGHVKLARAVPVPAGSHVYHAGAWIDLALCAA